MQLGQFPRIDLALHDLELRQRAEAARAVAQARGKATGEPVAVRIDSKGRLYVRPLSESSGIPGWVWVAAAVFSLTMLRRSRP